jgi:hypothetical protein
MPDGSYVQEFPLISQNVDRETATMRIRKNGQAVMDVEYYNEFMAWPSNQEDIVYILDIRETGETSPDGEALYQVSYTTQSVIPESALGMDTAFGLGGGLYFTMSMRS